jgi:hypothetical protein
MKINSGNLLGRWVTVKWEDVGPRAALVVEKINTKEFRIFEPHEGCARISKDQIIDVRQYQDAA